MLDAAASKRAAAEGWGLNVCIDNDSRQVFLMIVKLDDRFKTDAAAGAYVVHQAKANSRFHQDTLGLLMASRVQPARKKK